MYDYQKNPKNVKQKTRYRDKKYQETQTGYYKLYIQFTNAKLCKVQISINSRSHWVFYYLFSIPTRNVQNLPINILRWEGENTTTFSHAIKKIIFLGKCYKEFIV